MCPTRPRCFLPALALLLLCGCKGASNLLYEPKATDPLDGYEGSLAQAGISTEMDWGPKQNTLLSEYKTLKETHVQLEKRLEQVLAENRNLKGQTESQGTSLDRERALRAQAEAETEMLRQRRRDLEARILGLSIEKAKLEQVNLLSKIDALRQSLAQASPAAEEASATPPRSR